MVWGPALASLPGNTDQPAGGYDEGGYPSDDLLLASAASFLIQGGEQEAANVLLSCALSATYEEGWSFNQPYVSVDMRLTGPRDAYDILMQADHPVTRAVRRALGAVLPHGADQGNFGIRAELINIDPEWRTELLEIARGRGILNQASRIEGGELHVWSNLRFRSRSEVQMARALDRAGVLFLPNCMGRLGQAGNRRNREADFLICTDGKWGILEVDGEPFHPPSRTVEDHERDRLFKSHGISVIEHFDATRCYQDGDGVVAEFLQLLRSS